VRVIRPGRAACGRSAGWAGWSAGGTCEVGGDDVGGVPVEGDPGPVIAHGGVRGGFLDVAQWDAGVQRCGDEGVAQGVWPDGLADAGTPGDPSHDPASAVPVHPLPVGSEEDRAVESFTDGQVDRTGGAGCQRDGDDLAALAQHGQGAVSAFKAELVDIGAEASEIRRPLIASSDIRACSLGTPGPAATSSEPTSLRSNPIAWDS